jgi:hypothetical protein
VGIVTAMLIALAFSEQSVGFRRLRAASSP